VRIAAKYCDVVSFNFYKFTLDDVSMPEGIDKPAIVGEFHMGALDRGKFHTGLRSVFNQNQRAEAYRLYMASALRNPAIVGRTGSSFTTNPRRVGSTVRITRSGFGHLRHAVRRDRHRRPDMGIGSTPSGADRPLARSS